MKPSRADILRERIAQLVEVISGFEVTRSQYQCRLDANPSLRAELQRKIDLNDRTLGSLRLSLEKNHEELREELRMPVGA